MTQKESAPAPTVTRLRVRNFRSIVDASVSFGRVTCLVGPNNAGKTNLLDALAFLAEVAADGLLDALTSRGGLERVRNYSAAPGDQVEVSVTWDQLPGFPSGPTEYALAFDAAGFLTSETLVTTNEDTSFEHLRTQRDDVDYAVEWRQLASNASQGYRTNPTNSALITENRNEYPRQLGVIRAEILAWEFYRFAPHFLKNQGPSAHQETLNRVGSNFASYLHTVHSEHRKAFNRIEEQLRSNFPDVEELLTPLRGTNTLVGIREKWYSRAAFGDQLSDGLVGFLAHLAVLYGPSSPRLVVFEEPENYVHARLMERLVEMIREASREVQVLLTTHSVSLLNRLDIGDIRVVERVDGGTRARSPGDDVALRRALGEWALGEAYVSGELGGVP